MNKILIIGIGFKKGRGKDLFASQLLQHNPFVHRYNPVRIGFADALKQEFAGLMDTTVEEIEANKPLWRGGLQWYGTEYTQQIKGEKTYWVKRIEDRLPYLLRCGHRALIISDVRFNHEVEFVKRHGGKLIRVDRGGSRSDKHQSESELDTFDGWDRVIDNNGSVDALQRKAFEFANEVVTEGFVDRDKVTVGI